VPCSRDITTRSSSLPESIVALADPPLEAETERKAAAGFHEGAPVLGDELEERDANPKDLQGSL
jgi:hypothetical protein